MKKTKVVVVLPNVCIFCATRIINGGFLLLNASFMDWPKEYLLFSVNLPGTRTTEIWRQKKLNKKEQYKLLCIAGANNAQQLDCLLL